MDNCVKSIVDGLNNVAYLDDRQVVRLMAERRNGQVERAEVTIREAGQI